MKTKPGNGTKLLAAYLKAHRNRFPTDAAFAGSIGCSRGRLSQLLGGRGGNVRPSLAIAIHRETDGAVPGNILRPDLWRRSADVPAPARAAQ